MKKTLIALAAVAATGASFAQVTMSGNIGVSWQQSPVISLTSTGANAWTGQHVQGLAIQDGEIYITATEDMGAGWGATARGGFTMRGRGNPVVDRDATVSLRTPAGVVTAGALRACGSITGQALSGVVTGTVYSGNESNNNVPIDKCSLVDVVVFGTKVSDVTLALTYGEFESGIPGTSGNDRGNGTGITFTDVSAQYTTGALFLGVDWTHFNATTINYTGANQTAAPSASAANFVAVDGVDRYRLYAKYDAGFAKFGLGYQMKGMAADQYAASVAVPMGNLTLGLDYMARGEQTYAPKTNGEAYAGFALSGSRLGDKASSAVGLGANYNFSKTAILNVSYITYSDAGANARFAPNTGFSAALPMNQAANNTATGSTAAQLDTEYRIRLMKTF